MSSDQPLVTVVVPCLNRAAYLRPTVDSILAQDYPLVECVVVDGGSTDGTLDILRGYGDRIRWISEKDHGHADAINRGWAMGSGEILAWLNADDTWEVPAAVREAVSYLVAHPDVAVVYGDCGFIDAEGRRVGMSYVHDWDLAYAVLNCDHCIAQPAAFLRRSALERAGLLDVSFPSKKDHELWLRVGLIGAVHHYPALWAHERKCPGYMASRGDVTAQCCVALTEKFYRIPGIPQELRLRRRRALSNARLRGMEYPALDVGHWAILLHYAATSVLIDPANAGNTFRRLKLCAQVDRRRSLPVRLLGAVLEAISLPVRHARRLLKPRTGAGPQVS